VTQQRELAPYGAARDVSLVELVDRILGTGVTVSGELVLSVAGVDLVVIELRALLASVSAALAAGAAPRALEADTSGAVADPWSER